MIFKILSIIIIVMAWNQCNSLMPPSATEICGVFNNYRDVHTRINLKVISTSRIIEGLENIKTVLDIQKSL